MEIGAYIADKPITCQTIIAAIEAKFPLAFRAREPAPAEPAPVHAPARAPEAARDPWDDISELRWPLRGDIALDEADVLERLCALRERGMIDKIKLAIQTAVSEMFSKRPDIQASHAEAVQIAALGEDMVESVCTSPELLEFVKSELQAVDLAALLQAF